MKHTPGPWIVCKNASGNPFIYEDATGKTISGVAFAQRGTDAEEAEANAALIAAAPDMLAALEGIIQFIPKSSAKEGGAVTYCAAVLAADCVRSAIAKARGQA